MNAEAYVLVGLQQPSPPRLFENFDRGSDKVMAQMRERLVRPGLGWVELETRWDVDRPEDLARLESNGKRT